MTEPHRGVLPCNITAAALVSNRAVRRLAPGNVAAFLSRDVVQGLGLTPAELVLARATALRYAGKLNKPARLVQTMLRFGIAFLRLGPLSREQLRPLSVATTCHLGEVLEDPDYDSDDASRTSSNGAGDDEEQQVPELNVDWVALTDECGDLPLPDNVERCWSVEYHLDRMLRSFLQQTNGVV